MDGRLLSVGCMDARKNAVAKKRRARARRKGEVRIAQKS
jgi:hypothetical protein